MTFKDSGLDKTKKYFFKEKAYHFL
jgi:hypothetical protein